MHRESCRPQLPPRAAALCSSTAGPQAGPEPVALLPARPPTLCSQPGGQELGNSLPPPSPDPGALFTGRRGRTRRWRRSDQRGGRASLGLMALRRAALPARRRQPAPAGRARISSPKFAGSGAARLARRCEGGGGPQPPEGHVRRGMFGGAAAARLPPQRPLCHRRQ